MRRDRSNGFLREELREAYETHRRYSFTPEPPGRPLAERRRAQGRRVARIYLGMTLGPVLLFRIRNALLRRTMPILPYVCDLISTAIWHVSIGRHVQIGKGLLFPHGHAVIDGQVSIGEDCVINPWVTIGLNRRRSQGGLDPRGPTIGDRVYIGTGAKLLGPIAVGDDVRIGANAVVIEDVPAGTTAVGAPARIVQSTPPAWEAAAGQPAPERTRSE